MTTSLWISSQRINLWSEGLNQPEQCSYGLRRLLQLDRTALSTQTVLPTKTITIFPNQKLRMDSSEPGMLPSGPVTGWLTAGSVVNLKGHLAGQTWVQETHWGNLKTTANAACGDSLHKDNNRRLEQQPAGQPWSHLAEHPKHFLCTLWYT